jgi:tetratricopeptide (TPR) repeat protein
MTLPPSKRQQIVRQVCIALALVIATVVVYLPVRDHEFVNLDDNVYVTENPNLRGGLTWRSVRWAFTAGLTHDDRNADYWRPLCFLSHALDIECFGLRPAGHHLMNVAIHAVAAVALFLVLQSMTGAPWRCAFVAALFALHPLRVESVAWVAERKDVLSGLFFMLTLGAYVRYVRGPFSMSRYLTVLFVFALALMSKPMVATLPFVLLLLDYWPLGRTRWARPATGEVVTVSPSRLLQEKLPLFALAVALSVVTFWGQRHAGGIEFVRVPPGIRVANALISYVDYIGKMFWPTRLAVFYPLHPILPAAAIGAGVGLIAVTAAVIWGAGRRPWLVTGWFWYLGMLVPVIGLVQGAGEAMADRFVYLPLVGLSIMLCWSVPSRVMERRGRKVITGGAAAAVLAVCAALSRAQVRYWKDSETLFRHALLNVTRDNWLAHNNLGGALEQAGKHEEAIEHYKQGLRINPDHFEALNNLGVILEQTGKNQDAIKCFRQVLRIKPDFAEAYNNLGIALLQLGRVQEATAQWEQALRINSDYADAHNNLAIALEQTGKVRKAIGHYEQALRIKPDYADAHNNLGNALLASGKTQEAMAHLEQALRIKPDYAEAHNNLGLALRRMGKLPEAIGHYEQALRIKPDFAEAHNNLGLALVRLGRLTEAMGHWERALRIKPDYAEVHNNLGVALAQLGKVPEAIGHYEQALRIKPDYADAHNNLGNALLASGKTQEAMAHLEQALRIKPDDAEAHYNLGSALAQSGRFDEAISHYEQALRIKPDYPDAQNELARLRAVQ